MKRRIFLWPMALVVVLAFPAGVCWIGAGRLAMPPRKPLLERHRAALAEVAAGGVGIREARTDAGVSFLVCEPSRMGSPGVRGRILRNELEARGVPPGDYGEVVGTVVLLHGWGMRKEDLLRVAERFCAAGMRCVIPDLPGHGDNPVRHTGFGFAQGEAEFAVGVLDAAASRFGLPKRPAALWGLSMGGAYAISAAAAHPSRWRAMIVVSSFDALGPVVREQIVRSLGSWATILEPGLAVATRCRSGVWLANVEPARLVSRTEVPAMFVHGDADALIPLTAGRRLHDSAASPWKRWVPVSDATHGNVLGTPQQVFVEMAAWILAAPETRNSKPDPQDFRLQLSSNDR